MHSHSFAMCLGNLPFLSKSRTRSVSPENVHGEKGKGGMAELSGARYLPLQDDIASVAYWYQTHTAFPKFPDKDQLEVI